MSKNRRFARAKGATWRAIQDYDQSVSSGRFFERIYEQLRNEFGDANAHSDEEHRAHQSRNSFLGIFELNDVLPYATFECSEREYIDQSGAKWLVKMDSERYHIFRSNNRCAICDLVGDRMLLELPLNCHRPHFNLYGEEDGHLIMFTKDHINPKSKGGKDNLDNFRTLCCICNEIRRDGRADSFVHELRQFHRRLGDLISDEITRRSLIFLIAHEYEKRSV